MLWRRPPVQSQTPDRLSAVEGVEGAIENDPDGFEGVFAFTVRGSGQDNGWAYLNSMADYRHPDCLTIAMSPATRDYLRGALGEDPTTYFLGEDIVVSGTARRVPIQVYSASTGEPAYIYHQTHLQVIRLDQIHSLMPS